MIENTHTAFRAGRVLFVATLALPISLWATGQDASSPGAQGKLNLQLPAQSANPTSYIAGNESKWPSGVNAETFPEASQERTQNAPRFTYIDTKKQRASSISAAESAFQSHKDMFNRQSRCPTPFGPVPSPTSAPKESQLPNCQTWRKPTGIR